MGIKQQGGIFGRNPTFNNVTVDGILTVDQIVEKTGAAGITLDGVTLKDGNVVLADGKGIDFSATSGTGTSELFSDYEEGVWSPAWTNLTVGDGTSTGRYTKFGRTVFVEVDFLLGSTSVVGSSPEINNLPFASAADFQSFGGGSYTDAGTNTDQASCFVVANSNRLIPFRYNISGSRALQTAISATTPFTWAANDRIRLSVTYTAAG
jgi:hypothetical protein